MTVTETIPTSFSMTIGGELQLGFATQFALSYNDKGSRGSHNGAFYQPQPSEGFWSLGS